MVRAWHSFHVSPPQHLAKPERCPVAVLAQIHSVDASMHCWVDAAGAAQCVPSSMNPPVGAGPFTQVHLHAVVVSVAVVASFTLVSSVPLVS